MGLDELFEERLVANHYINLLESEVANIEVLGIHQRILYETNVTLHARRLLLLPLS